jgi:hypothetical protein
MTVSFSMIRAGGMQIVYHTRKSIRRVFSAAAGCDGMSTGAALDLFSNADYTNPKIWYNIRKADIIPD